MPTHRDRTFVIAGDYAATRMTLRTILAENGFRVLGEASNGHESVRVCGELKPDIAVLDLSMPILSDLEAVRLIKIHHPPTKVIILTVCAAGLHLLESLALGASAYITKNKAAGCLLDAVEAISEGDIYVRLASNDYLMTMSPSAAEHFQDQSMAQRLLRVRNNASAMASLSRREGEVLDGILRTLANKEIACELNLTERTVKFHVSSLLAKFKVRNRIELMRETSLQTIRPYRLQSLLPQGIR